MGGEKYCTPAPSRTLLAHNSTLVASSSGSPARAVSAAVVQVGEGGRDCASCS